MKIGVLTSSRADYGIYRPLLQKLSKDTRFDLSILVFGMHLISRHGNTVLEIEKDDLGRIYKVSGMPEGDSRLEIVKGYGELIKNFGEFWSESDFDCVIALGDRWEMSAAIQATIPFELKVAHIHGGETTLGATDNIYRHQISLASSIHFTAAELFSERVKELTQSKENVHTVGSISLEGLNRIELPIWETVKEQFSIPFDQFILVTIHPESVNADSNAELANTSFEALSEISKEYPLLITKANADVMGTLFNERFEDLARKNPEKVKVVASLGKLNYFSTMKQCLFLLGNTSSGILEAASFKKWVINLGDRQKGRLQSGNVLDVPFEKNKILNAVNQVANKQPFEGKNKYVSNQTTDKILNGLLKL